jgi:hypothetical protein
LYDRISSFWPKIGGPVALQSDISKTRIQHRK